MHFDTVAAHEWQGEGSSWYRVEVWRDGHELKASSYCRQRGAEWVPCGGQQMAMARSFHLKRAQEAA